MIGLIITLLLAFIISLSDGFHWGDCMWIGLIIASLLINEKPDDDDHPDMYAGY